MSSLAVPRTNVIQLHREEPLLNQQKSTPSPQENITTANPVLTHQRQRHPHRQYQCQYQYQYQNSNQFQYFDTEIVRLHLKDWMVRYVMYNESVCKYLTFQEFSGRIKEFNATSSRLKFYQIMISSFLLVVTSAFAFVSTINPEKKMIFGTASLITFTLAFINYWHFIRNGKLHTKYLNKLMRKFNRDDVSKNIYWKLIKTGHNRTTQHYLIIELNKLKPSSIYEKKNTPQVSVIYDYDRNSSELNNICRSNFINFDDVTVTKNDVNDVEKNNTNGNDNNGNDPRHLSINFSNRVTSTELLSTRASVDNAQIHKAVRTSRPYELKLPTYYEIKVNTEKSSE